MIKIDDEVRVIRDNYDHPEMIGRVGIVVDVLESGRYVVSFWSDDQAGDEYTCDPDEVERITP